MGADPQPGRAAAAGRAVGLALLLVLLPFVGPLARLGAARSSRAIASTSRSATASGMTVLAALLFPVWASILGFGPARWLGTELTGRGGAGRRSAAHGRSATLDDAAAYVPRATPPAYTPPSRFRRSASSTPPPSAPPLPPASGRTPPPVLPAAPAPSASASRPRAAADAGVVRCPAAARRRALGVRAAARRGSPAGGADSTSAP